VKQVTLEKNAQGLPKGCGTVQFSDPSSAALVIHKLNHLRRKEKLFLVRAYEYWTGIQITRKCPYVKWYLKFDLKSLDLDFECF
jgi:hypothetical protein